MSAFTVIRLDTHPPVITWGPVTDANGGETMTVLYLLDEPQMINAVLRLNDSRVIEGNVFWDRITFDLPDDAPEGVAILSATLTDDVGNSTVAFLNVAVSGIPPVEQYIPVLPGPPVVETPWRTLSRARTHSRYSILTTARRPSQATLRSRYRVTRRLADVPHSSAVGRSGGAVRAHLGSKSTVSTREQWTFAKQPEGPETEAEIIALGLL